MTYRIGDIVEFKADIEQCGKIVEITDDSWSGLRYKIVPVSGRTFDGEYISDLEEYWIRADDCFGEED